jgi:hypothetical protein
MKLPAAFQSIKPYRAAFALAILLVLAVTGVLQRLSATIAEPMTESNAAYLDRAIKNTVHLMVPIGVAKGAADVIEGSEAVVEFGDMVQPLLEYLDIAWRILLLSLMISTGAKYVLLGSPSLAGPLLIISLSCYVGYSVGWLVCKKEGALLFSAKRIGAFCLLGYLFFALVLPLTVFCTAALSDRITEPLKTDVTLSFDRVGKIFSMESITEQDAFLDKVDAMRGKAVELIRFSTRSAAFIAGKVARLAVVKILEGVVFPLSAFAFLIWLIRGTLYPALGLSERPVAERDLRRLAAFVKEGTERAATGAEPEDA